MLPDETYNRIGSIFLDPLADLNRFVERVAFPFPGIKRVAVVDGADLHLEVEARPDLFPDRLDDFVDESVSVTKRSAVFVLAVVDPRAEELGDQVAVGSMQLDAIEAGFLRPQRSLGEVLDDVLDFRVVHRLADDTVERVGSARRALRVLVFVLDTPLVLLAAGVAELHDELAAVLMDALADLTPELDLVIVVDHGVVHHDPSPDADRGIRRDDAANSPSGELLFPIDSRVAS